MSYYPNPLNKGQKEQNWNYAKTETTNLDNDINNRICINNYEEKFDILNERLVGLEYSVKNNLYAILEEFSNTIKSIKDEDFTTNEGWLYYLSIKHIYYMDDIKKHQIYSEIQNMNLIKVINWSKVVVDAIMKLKSLLKQGE